MKFRILQTSLVALVVGVGSTLAQGTGPGDRPDANGMNLRDQMRVNIPRNVELPTDVQDLVNQFRSGLRNLIEERRALIESLGDASEEEIRAALGELREAHRDEIAAQRELARQLRKEIRELRRERAGDEGGEG